MLEPDDERCGQLYVALLIGGIISLVLWTGIIVTLVRLMRKS